MKILKILAFFSAAALALTAGCKNPPDADSPQSAAPAAPADAPRERPAPSDPPRERETETPKKADGAALPAPEKAGTPPAPAARVPAAEKTLRFSCAFWRMPENPPALFLKDGNRDTRMVLFEQTFPNIYSVRVGADASVVTIYARGADGALAPFCAIDASGMEECAAIIFPKYDPANPDTRKYVRAFDVGEKAFPRGAYRICNFTGRTLRLKITPENAGYAAVFAVKSGETVLSPRVTGGRQERFDFEAWLPPEEDDADGQPKLIWKTIGFLKSDERLCVILAEDEKRSQETGKLKLQTRSLAVPSFAPENKK